MKYAICLYDYLTPAMARTPGFSLIQEPNKLYTVWSTDLITNYALN